MLNHQWVNKGSTLSNKQSKQSKEGKQEKQEKPVSKAAMGASTVIVNNGTGI